MMSTFRFPLLPLLLIGLFLLTPGACPLARPRPHYAIAGHEKPVALLQVGRATYLVTQQSVFQLEGSQFVRKYQGNSLIQCAALADTVLWLGTRQGVLRLNTHQFSPRKLALPVADSAPSITALFQDARGELWVGAKGVGLFHWLNGAFAQELNTPSINAGVATADSSIWIATNIGLNRRQNQEWIRYNEEGVANHELPDNIVEKLLPDNAGNLWVIMSDAICVFEGRARHAAAEAELPTVKFLGQPGNEVFGVAYLPGEGHLFATAMGLLLLPNGRADYLDSFAPFIDKIEQKRLLVPLPTLPGQEADRSPYLVQVDQRRRVWLVSEEEVTVLTTPAFHRFIHSKAIAKTDSKGLVTAQK